MAAGARPRARAALRLSAALALAAPATAGAAPGLVRVVQDDTVLLRSGPAARAAALDELRALGVDVVRVNLVWRELDARPERWADAEDLAATASARGMRLLATLTTPAPRAAAPNRPGTRPGTYRPDPAGFAAFAAEAAIRLPADTWFSLINEPNSPNQLMPQHQDGRPASPALYRRLVNAAMPALAGRRVLLGEQLGIARRSRAQGAPVAPRAFLRGFLCLDGRDRPLRCADPPRRLDVAGWAVHPYYPPAGPLLRPRRADTLLPGTVGRLLPTLDAGARHGRLARRIDLWDTEQGSQSNPPDRLFGAPLSRQAANVNTSEWIAWRTPRVRSFAQYLLRDDLLRDGFQSGLRFTDGRAKPALAAFRWALHARRTGRRRAEVWLRAARPGATLRIGGATRRIEHAGYARFTIRVPAGPVTLRLATGRRITLRPSSG